MQEDDIFFYPSPEDKYSPAQEGNIDTMVLIQMVAQNMLHTYDVK